MEYSVLEKMLKRVYSKPFGAVLKGKYPCSHSELLSRINRGVEAALKENSVNLPGNNSLISAINHSVYWFFTKYVVESYRIDDWKLRRELTKELAKDIWKQYIHEFDHGKGILNIEYLVSNYNKAKNFKP